eukprot:jgi/Tetstr1/424017/TSEL_014628.t1
MRGHAGSGDSSRTGRRIVVVAATVLQQAWLLTASADDCESETSEEDCTISPVIKLLVVGKQMLCTILVPSLLFSRTFAILRYRRALRWALREGGGQTAAPADHWTAVASLDTFNETAGMVSVAQLIVYITIGSSTGVATAAQIRYTFVRYTTLKMRKLLVQACCPECEPFDADCPCDVLCRYSYGGLEAFLTMNIGVISCLLATVAFIPLSVWSPVADGAFAPNRLPKEPHFTVLKRILALPVPLSVLTSLVLVMIAIYVVNFMVPGAIHGVMIWRCMLVANACTGLALLGLLVWSASLRRLVTLPIFLVRTCASALYGLVSRCAGNRKGTQNSRGLATITHLWRCQSSWRYRQVALLCTCLYCFVIEALNLESEGVVELNISRVITLLLLLVTRDAEVQPDELATKGAGFGMLVPASRLAAALKAHLAEQPYRGRMPRYKATKLRMDETLAVSYRWHDEASVPLGDGGLELNINRWQAASLLAAIEAAGCQYVWMDTLAIPQDVAEVQSTLLSRMMAVYSSAAITLVLRSAEAEGGRYHQRVWTLQEYCAAQALIVLTEEGGDVEGGEAGLAAVLGGEDEVIEALRLQHMARLAECQPVWLSEGGPTGIMRRIGADDAKAIWATYQTLSARLQCRYHADVVRALYPLIWNRPAESEEELVALMRALEEVHGIPQDELVAMLQASSSRRFKQGLHVPEPEDEVTRAGLIASLKSGFSVRSIRSSAAAAPAPAPVSAWMSRESD